MRDEEAIDLVNRLFSAFPRVPVTEVLLTEWAKDLQTLTLIPAKAAVEQCRDEFLTIPPTWGQYLAKYTRMLMIHRRGNAPALPKPEVQKPATAEEFRAFLDQMNTIVERFTETQHVVHKAYVSDSALENARKELKEIAKINARKEAERKFADVIEATKEARARDPLTDVLTNQEDSQ